MSDSIREAALKLGYADARPVTGHPFRVWRERLDNIPLGQTLSFDHDPALLSGWPLGEITLWVAIAPTPPLKEWPEGCGELGAHYVHSVGQERRREAWEEAAEMLGYEVIPDAMLPERAAAIRAGFGVQGLNGLLITPDYGSYVNIAVLLIRSAPPEGARGPEHDLSSGCNKCGECIKVCPTGAISEDGVDALKCLRHYMRKPETMPEDAFHLMGRRIMGCETCQQVCPDNDSLKREDPPQDLFGCMRIESLLTKPETNQMTIYIDSYYIPENRVRAQAHLAAANTGRNDLLPLIEVDIGSDDEARNKTARWAADILKAQ